MLRFLSFIISFFISTTLVFAQHTISYYSPMRLTSESQQLLSAKNACSPVNKTKILKKLKRKIRTAERKNETIDKSISRILAKYDKHRKKEIRKIERVLRSERKTDKLFSKLSQNNPNLTKEIMVDKLLTSTSEVQTLETKKNIQNELLSYGSYSLFLKDAYTKIEKCDQERSVASLDNQGETLYLILLILFIGTPILALIAAIVVLIIGMFSLALWLAVYAVGVLAIFFVISNLGNKGNPSQEIIPLPRLEFE